MSNKIKLIFIVGVGRSGTSLLQSMLGTHPKIAVLPETQFFRKYIADEKKAAAINQQELIDFVKELHDDDRFERLNINLLALFNISSNHFPLGIYKAILNQYCFKEKCEIIVDKDPRNLDYLAALYQYFPTAKVLHIYRDPRDVVLSKTKAKWSARRPYFLHALIGQAQLARGRKIGQDLFKDNFIEVKYEDLIQTPEQILQLICKQLDVPFDTSMLQFEKTAKVLVATKEMPWKKETLGPLLKNNTQKWKDNFSKNQIRTIEVCSPYAFQQLAYQYSKRNSFLYKIIWIPARVIFQILYRYIKI